MYLCDGFLDNTAPIAACHVYTTIHIGSQILSLQLMLDTSLVELFARWCNVILTWCIMLWWDSTINAAGRVDACASVGSSGQMQV